MPTYAYIVKDQSGRKRVGHIEMLSRRSVLEQLWKQDFIVLSVKERRKLEGKNGATGGRSGGGVKSEQLVIFSRQLATMVASGIPIIASLDVLSQQVDDAKFRNVLKRIREEVEGGSNFSESLAKHPRIFSEFFVNMIRAGESSGKLDEILDRLAAYTEKVDALRRKVIASLFYPAMVVSLVICIVVAVMLFLVPMFRDIYASLGGKLPGPTLFLLQTSDALRHYCVGIVALLLLLAVLGRLYLHTSQGRMLFDQTKLHVPIIGIVLRKVAIARFARTLATLVRSGVPILESLEIVAKTAGNKVIERAVFLARSSIKEGENIADPLAVSKIFPPMVTRMIAVGEKTGELERMLSKLADFYENEVDTAVSGLTSLIEPLIIAFLGLAIGGIAVALFLPITNLSQLVAH